MGFVCMVLKKKQRMGSREEPRETRGMKSGRQRKVTADWIVYFLFVRNNALCVYCMCMRVYMYHGQMSVFFFVYNWLQSRFSPHIFVPVSWVSLVLEAVILVLQTFNNSLTKLSCLKCCPLCDNCRWYTRLCHMAPDEPLKAYLEQGVSCLGHSAVTGSW